MSNREPNELSAEKIQETLCRYQPELKPPDNGLRRASVFVPFYPRPEGLSIIFTKRPDNLASHSGQISFPGGGREADDQNNLATALRETYEEIGVKPEDVEVWGRLKPERTPASSYYISPFVGQIPYPYDFKVNFVEVERLIIVPLAHLLDPNYFDDGHYEWRDQVYRTHTYTYGDDVIWGLTARILNNLFNLLGTGSEPENTYPLSRPPFRPNR